MYWLMRPSLDVVFEFVLEKKKIGRVSHVSEARVDPQAESDLDLSGLKLTPHYVIQALC